jgi:CheY-like chemotaxis protein
VTPQLKSTQPVRVLVVDDERDVRDSLVEILEDAGYVAFSAEHGVDALAQLGRIPPPDAILLDLFMPQMNGWRFAEQLRQRTDLAGVPVIVVTAAGPYWGPPVPQERVLRKPFQSGHLLKLLEQVVGSA